MPTANNLTDNKCRAAKPTNKPQKLFDGHGLHLYISPSGAKTWRVAYRLAGKPQTASLGPYPLLSLADARVKRDELRRKLLDGSDPRAKPKPTLSVRQACEEYWDGRQDVTERYRSNAKKAMEAYIYPKLGKRPMGDVTRDEMLETLLVLDKAGRYSYVRKTRTWIAMVFDWGVARNHCSNNPAREIQPKAAFGANVVEHFAAVELNEVHALFDRIRLEADLISVLATRMLGYTWARTVEVRRMKWEQIDGDLWRVPRTVMKKRRDHLVPLCKQAVKLLAVLKERCRGSEYVFPAEHRTDRTISENTVLYLLYRMGFKGKMTGHGFRTIGSTWANENGFNPDAVEMALSHATDNTTRATYNRAKYLQERRDMLQAWADWLDNPNAGRDEG